MGYIIGFSVLFGALSVAGYLFERIWRRSQHKGPVKALFNIATLAVALVLIFSVIFYIGATLLDIAGSA